MATNSTPFSLKFATEAQFSVNGEPLVQDFLSNAAQPEPAVLPSSCHVGDAQVANCSEACFDPEAAFANGKNIYTCVGIGLAALKVQNGQVADADSVRRADEALAFGDLAAFDAERYFRSLLSCYVSACAHEGDYIPCNGTVLELADAEPTLDLVESLDQTLDLYCGPDEPEEHIENDVYGTGVVVSYIIQIAIALYFFLGLEVSSSWATYVTLPFLLVIRKAQRSEEGAWERAKRLQRKLTGSAQAATLRIIAIDFQEAQSFFVLAIQTATLLTFSRFRTHTDPKIQYIVSTNTTYNMAVNGVLPVLFFQVYLQGKKMRSWYTVSLTTLCVVLSFVCLKNNPRPFRETFGDLVASSRTDECGGNPHLKTMCYYFRWKGNGDFSLLELTQPILPVHILEILILPVLIVDHILFLLGERAQDSGPRWADAKPLRRAHDVWARVRAAVWLALRLVMLTFMVIYLAAILKLLYRLPSFSRIWSFGQIVALVVWAPVVWKYAYFSIAGIEVAFLTRLPRNYAIIRRSMS